MTTFFAEIVVTLKEVVNDPQGLVVRDSLHRLGFTGVQSARIGKHIVLELDAENDAAARAQAERMCEKLLRNPVIEDHRVTVRPSAVAEHS